MAQAIAEANRLKTILEELRIVTVRRALAAWDRSTETFGEEIVALNDVVLALNNIDPRD